MRAKRGRDRTKRGPWFSEVAKLRVTAFTTEMKFLALVLPALFVLAAAVDNTELSGGADTKSGRVKVLLDGSSTFQQVCSDGFDATDAEVVCKSLGYDTKGQLMNGQYGIDSSGLGIRDVDCTGSEATILDCSYNRHPGFCTSIAGVDCNEEQPPEVGTTGTLGLEAGIIAAIVICVASLISVGAGIGVCLYRNDLCPCCQKTPGGEV